MSPAHGRAPVPELIADRSKLMVVAPVVQPRQRTPDPGPPPAVAEDSGPVVARARAPGRRTPATGRVRLAPAPDADPVQAGPGRFARGRAPVRPVDRPEPGRAPEPGVVAARSATARLLLAVLGLGSLAVGAAGAAIGVGPLRAAGLLVFFLAGVGCAPWQHNAALRLPARLALAVLTGLSILTLLPTVLVVTGTWHPTIAFVAVAVACAGLHLSGARRALRDAGAADLRQWWRTVVHRPTPAAPPLGQLPVILVAGLGALLCLGAALAHRGLEPGLGGFLTQIGPGWYIGLALLLAALVSAPRQDERQLAIPVLLLFLVLSLTPALVYDGPRSQSAAKHVDLVQQIRTLHRPDSVVQVYNAWPGFFAAMAWICDVAGIRDPMRLVAFWPAVIGVFRIAALRYFFGQVLPTAFRCWVAVTLTVLIDLMGQDYFAPQSVGLVIGLASYGLALSERSSPLRQGLLLLVGATLAVSHQLSPYIVGGALVILVLFRQVRPWWTPLLVLTPSVVWTVLHRDAVDRFLSLRDIGRPANFLPPRAVRPPDLDRLPIVGATVRALLLALAIVAVLALVGLLRHRTDRRLWAMACCPAAGLGLVAINPYGQEGIFRAAVFGVPWLALLAATAVPQSSRVWSRLPLLATTAALTAAFLVAAFGLDATNVSRPADVAAFRSVQAQVVPGQPRMHYLLQLGPGDLPGPVPTRRLNYRPLSWDDLGGPAERLAVLGDAPPERQVARLTARLLDYTREPVGAADLYAIWSPVSAWYGQEYGLHRPAEFAALRQSLRASPYWAVVFERDGTVVFHFLPHRYPGGNP